MVAVELEAARLPASRDEGIEWLVGDALRLRDVPAFDGILSNPPYRRNTHLSTDERRRLRVDFESAWGQFDQWFVFVEKAVRLLAPGGRAVLLVPNGLETRPAAARLRTLLDRTGEWKLLAAAGNPYSTDVSVHAEILCIDRSDVPTCQAPLGTADDIAVSVGAATGANSVFIRKSNDEALADVEKQFVVPVVRGRDIGDGLGGYACSPLFAVLPYQRQHGGLVVADLSRFPGLSRFLEANRPALTARSRGAVSRYIQCPPSAISGIRIVIPEVFDNPRFALVPDGTLVLNSAFTIPLPSDRDPYEVLHSLRSKAGPALRQHARVLSGDYRRITVTGAKAAMSAALSL
jgi:hypothetical protein